MTKDKSPSPYCSISEASRIARADRRTIIKWAESKIIKAVKRPDKRILIDRQSLMDCLKPLEIA